MGTHIRIATSENDFKKINEIAQYAFERSPLLEGLELRLRKQKHRKQSHQLILSKDGEDVATATLYHMTQNVRNDKLNMGGVAVIATMPHVRRKGYVTKLMENLFTYMHDNEFPVSILHPFKESFYARYGYVSLSHRHKLKISPSSLKKIFELNLTGNFELKVTQETFDRLYDIINKAITKYPGMIMFSKFKAKELLEKETWTLIVANENDVDIGAMVYSNSGYQGIMKVEKFVYLNEKGKLLLLKFIAQHIDQLAQAHVPIRPDSNIDCAIEDISVERDVFRGAMARIIDIQQLEGLTVGKGHLTIKLEDKNCKWNNGIWNLISEDNKLKIRKSEDEPEILMPIKAFTSIIYGTHSLEELVVKGLIQVDKMGKTRINKLFPRIHHHVNQYF